jgi:ketosteroid isomerase-like protein
VLLVGGIYAHDQSVACDLPSKKEIRIIRPIKELAMNSARAFLAAAMIFLAVVGAVPAQQTASATQEVTALLREFMAAAGRGDRAVFDKFFADDVIYTRATGVVITKADIMANLGKPATATDGKTTYSAEDITVHDYGEMVVVAFRLVGHAQSSDGKAETNFYRNTGTFVRRNGRWQAVAWQATKISDTSKIQ